MPGVPREGLRDHLRDRAQGVGNPCEKAECVEVGGMIRMVELRVSEQITWARGMLKGRQQCLRSLLADLDIRRMAIPTLAAKGHAAILRDHPCQDRLLQVRPVSFGVAIRDRHRLLTAIGNVFPMERKAGGVEMIEAQVNRGYLDLFLPGVRGQEERGFTAFMP